MADGEGDPLDRPRRAPDGDVVVPMRMYKAVMVFSTIIAVALVVAGFIILDTATRRAQAPLGEVDPLLAVLGVAVIGLGAGVYAFATRFRAEEMGASGGRADGDDADGGETE